MSFIFISLRSGNLSSLAGVMETWSDSHKWNSRKSNRFTGWKLKGRHQRRNGVLTYSSWQQIFKWYTRNYAGRSHLSHNIKRTILSRIAYFLHVIRVLSSLMILCSDSNRTPNTDYSPEFIFLSICSHVCFNLWSVDIWCFFLRQEVIAVVPVPRYLCGGARCPSVIAPSTSPCP
jgi:hypothetical protein